MKQVELKKYGFQNRGISRLIPLSGNSVPSGFHSMEENERLLMEDCSTIPKFYFKTLKWEIKSVFSEKHELEYRDLSILKVFQAVWAAKTTMPEETW